MNEQEIAEAIKIIREPITVHNEAYHYFDQENYDKLQRVYDNCQWFINNWEQLEQNYKDVKQENERLKKPDYHEKGLIGSIKERDDIITQLTNNWNELEEFLESNWKDTQDIWYVKIINKMKEIKEGK